MQPFAVKPRTSVRESTSPVSVLETRPLTQESSTTIAPSILILASVSVTIVKLTATSVATITLLAGVEVAATTVEKEGREVVAEAEVDFDLLVYWAGHPS